MAKDKSETVEQRETPPQEPAGKTLRKTEVTGRIFPSKDSKPVHVGGREVREAPGGEDAKPDGPGDYRVSLPGIPEAIIAGAYGRLDAQRRYDELMGINSVDLTKCSYQIEKLPEEDDGDAA